MSDETYAACVGVEYPADAKLIEAAKRGESVATKRAEPGEQVEAYAIEASPWLLKQGKVERRRSVGLVVDGAVKAKVSKKKVSSDG